MLVPALVITATFSLHNTLNWGRIWPVDMTVRRTVELSVVRGLGCREGAGLAGGSTVFLFPCLDLGVTGEVYGHSAGHVSPRFALRKAF